MEQLIERLLGRPFLAAGGDEGIGGGADAAAATTEAAGGDAGESTAEDTGDVAEATGDAAEGDGEAVEGDETAVAAKAVALTPEELADIDFGGGQQFKVDKKLAEIVQGFRNDYQQKTQAIAERNRAIEAEAQQLQGISQERLTAAAKLWNADQNLAAYSKLDWNQLQRDNPELAHARSIEWNQWQFARNQAAQEFAGLDAKLAETKRASALEAQGRNVTRIQEAVATYSREIPDWSKVASQLADYGRQQGFTPAELGLDPNRLDNVVVADTRVGKLMHKAMMWDQLAQKQKTAAQQRTQKPAATASAETAPLVTVTARNGGPGAKVSLEKASMDQYVATRQKQMAQKSARR